MLWNVITARHARAALALTITLTAGITLAQSSAPAPADPPATISPQVAGPWSILPALPDAVAAAPAWIRPARAQWLALDDAAMRAALAAAPLEGTPAANAPLVLTLPDPTGRLQRFAIVESPIMEPALAAQFPQIKTYAGKGLDDGAATIRLDLTPQGFHAQVLSPRRDADDADPRAGDLWPGGPAWPGGAWYIDPVSRNDWIHHASYFKRDLPNRHRAEWTCAVEAEPDDLEQIQGEVGISRAGPTLRTYRLAAACTGEYAAFHGGTVASAQAAIVTAINRVNQIYEVEFAIRLVLVANNTAIVFTDAASDPFTNGVPNTLIGESQTIINNLIGSANYDIGHTLNTGGGGLAGLGVVCRSTQKARGVTGLSSPTGDPFVIDYLCHELGHQFGASHTFNSSLGSCASNRSGSSAYEPGSGSTIMAYTGICAEDDLQRDADPMFHSRSFDQVLTYTTTGQGANCDATSSTGNTAPSVSAGAARTIPSQTPFILTATASDADGDALSYSWEQRDLGPAATLNTPDDGLFPLVRTRAPVTSPTRVVPRLSTILAGTTNNQERLPQVSRTMRWRVTARDNRAGGGGLNTSDVSLTVVGAAGPFRVTFPSGPLSWPATSTQTVSWDVAGTTANGINTAAVNILLSTDGGNTFPHTLATNTPNDGAEPVTIPETLSTNARIKIEPVGNIYFAISGGPITITSAPPPAPTNLTASPNPACPGQSVTFTAEAAPGLQIQWFSASCGSGFIAFGPSATLVMPESGLTVFCRARDTAAGVSSACASISVDPGAARPADFNGDGNTDPDDLSDFIACYFDPACPQADFNHDGSRDPDDLSDFIAAFFSGNAGGC
ncbi:MAG: hypothetical protein JNK35_11620 [Phycisphaerae bacterium]|nr:hypothetical protein [Phycisphaerae bacterium]